MRRFAALLPCLLACAGNHAPPLRTTIALAGFEASAHGVAPRSTSGAQAEARLAPPFHATSASVRRLDATNADALNAENDMSMGDHSAADLGPLADARRAP